MFKKLIKNIRSIVAAEKTSHCAATVQREGLMRTRYRRVCSVQSFVRETAVSGGVSREEPSVYYPRKELHNWVRRRRIVSRER